MDARWAINQWWSISRSVRKEPGFNERWVVRNRCNTGCDYGRVRWYIEDEEAKIEQLAGRKVEENVAMGANERLRAAAY